MGQTNFLVQPQQRRRIATSHQVNLRLRQPGLAQSLDERGHPGGVVRIAGLTEVG